jgi:hypothetical protein
MTQNRRLAAANGMAWFAHPAAILADPRQRCYGTTTIPVIFIVTVNMKIMLKLNSETTETDFKPRTPKVFASRPREIREKGQGQLPEVKGQWSSAFAKATADREVRGQRSARWYMYINAGKPATPATSLIINNLRCNITRNNAQRYPQQFGKTM